MREKLLSRKSSTSPTSLPHIPRTEGGAGVSGDAYILHSLLQPSRARLHGKLADEGPTGCHGSPSLCLQLLHQARFVAMVPQWCPSRPASPTCMQAPRDPHLGPLAPPGLPDYCEERSPDCSASSQGVAAAGTAGNPALLGKAGTACRDN